MIGHDDHVSCIQVKCILLLQHAVLRCPQLEELTLNEGQHRCRRSCTSLSVEMVDDDDFFCDLIPHFGGNLKVLVVGCCGRNGYPAEWRSYGLLKEAQVSSGCEWLGSLYSDFWDDDRVTSIQDLKVFQDTREMAAVRRRSMKAMRQKSLKEKGVFSGVLDSEDDADHSSCSLSHYSDSDC